jgi:hypothetical protein
MLLRSEFAITLLIEIIPKNGFGKYFVLPQRVAIKTPIEASKVLALLLWQQQLCFQGVENSPILWNFRYVSPHCIGKRLMHKQNQLLICFLILSCCLAKLF